MIAPRSRLLWWVGLVVVPAAAAAGLVPAARAGCLAAIAAVLLLAVADALLAPRALAGLTVSLPPLVRLSKDRQGHIDLRIHNRYSAARQIRLGLAFPPGFASPHEDLWTQL